MSRGGVIMRFDSKENMDQDEVAALSKIRNKTCVPSLLWQRLASTSTGNDIEPVLMRKAIYKRILPHLTTLKNKGYFEEVVVHVAKDKPGWIELVITGVGEQFAAYKPSPLLREIVIKGKGLVITDIASQHIAITGTLESLARNHAIQRIKDVGASFSSTITKKTTLLVVGKDSGKHKLAQAATKKIRTINEGDFLKLVGVSHTGVLPGL